MISRLIWFVLYFYVRVFFSFEGMITEILLPFFNRYLYEVGLDYRHGTGHGIGHFLNVHEGERMSYIIVFIP